MSLSVILFEVSSLYMHVTVILTALIGEMQHYIPVFALLTTLPLFLHVSSRQTTCQTEQAELKSKMRWKFWIKSQINRVWVHFDKTRKQCAILMKILSVKWSGTQLFRLSYHFKAILAGKKYVPCSNNTSKWSSLNPLLCLFCKLVSEHSDTKMPCGEKNA